MPNHDTTVPGVDPDEHRRVAAPRFLGLIVLWSDFGSTCTGEIAFLADAPEYFLGRDTSASPLPCLQFSRQSPYGLEPRPDRCERALSRIQATFRPLPDGRLEVRNTGLPALYVNGRLVPGRYVDERGVVRGRDEQLAVVAEGDRLYFAGALQLLVVRRPRELPPLRAYSDPEGRAHGDPDADGQVGESPPMWALRDDLAVAAGSPQPVLLTGQSGTGKELAAHALHRGRRRPGRLVPTNAGAVSPGIGPLLFFGCARNYIGSNTPAQPGYVGDAEKGTLFVDELGDLAPETQAALLRLLGEGGEYTPLGASTRRADLQIVAATNRPLTTIREDLRMRFKTHIRLPSLAERKEDIPLILRHQLRVIWQEAPDRYPEHLRDENAIVTPGFIEHMCSLPLTGNIRQMDSFLRARVEGRAPPEIVAPEPPRPPTARDDDPRPRGCPTRVELQAALDAHGGNVTDTAKALGVDRTTVHRWMKQLELEGPMSISKKK